jgi:Rrf2 family protein
MAMADIAQQGSMRAGTDADSTVSLSSISERQHISLAYLEQLFLKLRRAGLVQSERGRAGGYRLARSACEISIADILLAVDEGVRMTRCHGEDAAACRAGQRCITHGLWDALGETINEFLSGVTLQQVIEGGPASNSKRADVPAVLFTRGVTR